MNIRPFQPTDKDDLINLIRLNTPAFFDPSEEGDFLHYLNDEVEQYYVVEVATQTVGCGGINYFPDQQAARISWDMIHPDFQGKGIGKKLLHYRIDEIKKNVEVKKVIVRTSQLVYAFYEKAGFELDKIEKDFWAPGLHLYEMKMHIL